MHTIHPPHPLTIALAQGGDAERAAIDELIEKLRACEGRIERLATDLGVSRVTAIRLIGRAGLGDQAAKIRTENNVPGPRSSQLGQPQPSKPKKRRRRRRA